MPENTFMKTLLLSLSFILVTACASTGVSTTEVKLPYWFYNPNLTSFYGVAVKAQVQKFGGREAQMRAAMTMARVEIAKNARVQIRSSQTSATTATNKGLSEYSDTNTQISTGEVLRLDEVFLKEQWVHPETGELYIWLLMPK